MTEAISIIRRSSNGSLSIRAPSRAEMVGGITRWRSIGRAPEAIIQHQPTILDEEGRDLLKEQRMPLRRLDDPRPDAFVDIAAGQQVPEVPRIPFGRAARAGAMSR